MGMAMAIILGALCGFAAVEIVWDIIVIRRCVDDILEIIERQTKESEAK